MREIVVCSVVNFGSLAASDGSVKAFQRALEHQPSVVGVQAVSGDYGPDNLGAGSSKLSRFGVKADLELLVVPCLQRGVKFILGGCPSAGTKSCVEWTTGILREIAAEHKLHFRLAVIYSDVPKEYLLQRLARGERIRDLELPDECLTANMVEASTNIVAFMGWEPFVRALETGADVVLTGRCCDDAIFTGAAIRAGFEPGIAWHMGKIVECGGMAAKPVRTDIPLLATLREDSFVVEPMAAEMRCTVASVTAHNMYERRSAFRQQGPAGTLDMAEAKYEQINDRAVKVSGARFVPGPYQVLLEGAGLAGYRSISVAGVRDPEVVRRLPDFQRRVAERVQGQLRAQGNHQVIFHNYGIDGVMGAYEPNRGKPTSAYEVGVVTEVIAESQALANEACRRLYAQVHMMMYEGRATGEMNYASPFSSVVVEVGPAYRYTLNHLLPLDDPHELFRMELFDVSGSAWKEVPGW
ncbi:MAG: acyclic terpene utilization AtuA family protein [Chloroflexi bacterium]|nr:acyclic terpene utilization AtuA family protein [Chloroflexota bacterium]